MKPRLAWVAPYLPEPRTSGGVLRIQELAAHLSQEYELHLFCRGELWERRRLASDELNMFHSRWLGRDLWQGISSDLPRKTRRGSPRSMYREIARRHQNAPFQALILEHCWSAWGAFELRIPTLLDEHNIESAYLADWYAARAEQRPTWQRQVAAMRRWEQRAWCSATDVACVSEADAEHIAGYRKTPPTVVANGTQTHRIRWCGASGRNAGILFLGALHHPPNAQAAWRLATEIMPLVWQARPTATLDIVGPAPSAALKALASDRLRVHGKVPDVRPFLEQCAAFAFPLSQGAGSSLKTIEALAAGAPLVSSKLGARGFGLVPGEHYLQAASNSEFADALCAVLAKPDLYEGITRAGRARAELYDWSVQAGTFGSRVALMIR